MKLSAWVHKAFWGLMMLSLVVPLLFFPGYYMPFGGTKMTVFYTLVALLLPLMLCLVFSRFDWKEWGKQPIVLALLGFLLVSSVSALFGEDVFNSFLGGGQRFTSVLFSTSLTIYALSLMIFFALYPEWKQRFLMGALGVAVVIAGYGVLEALAIVPSPTPNARAASAMGNPIFLGSYLVIPLFFALWKATVTAGRTRAAFVVGALLLFGGILGTGTRGALLGVIAGMAVFAAVRIFREPKQRKRLLVGSVVVLVVGVLTVGLVDGLASEQSLADRLTTIMDRNASERLVYWSIAIRGWVDHPVLGVGPENFYTVADQYLDPDRYLVERSIWPDKPHSYPIEILVTTGLVGLGVFLALLFFVAKKLWREEDQLFASFALAGLSAYLVQSMFVFETISAAMMFMLLLAWIVPLRLRQSPEKTWKVYASGVGGALVAAVVLATIVWPVHQYRLVLGGSGEGTAVDQLNTLSEQSLVLDWRLVGRAYRDAFFDDAEALVESGAWESVLGNGLAAYAEATKRHPSRAHYWYEYAQLLAIEASVDADMAGYEQAADAMQRAGELAPNRLDVALAQIQLYATVGRLDEAQALYEQTSQDTPCWIADGEEGVLEIQCE